MRLTHMLVLLALLLTVGESCKEANCELICSLPHKVANCHGALGHVSAECSHARETVPRASVLTLGLCRNPICHPPSTWAVVEIGTANHAPGIALLRSEIQLLPPLSNLSSRSMIPLQNSPPPGPLTVALRL